ncbi:IclR family transcriptional regulator C-terminal domain-containing protein [Amycolatopsis endophytica]|uniref:IclR family pca regulon transcriptional regulator n=1 Tax=Amycolatopsis endophytica TaxID=860233 RepID=A0A853B246_9PSEU|nr:IclR family transcriptional regulator C-terminal domain-containing protein [Amycolatopsis endophytica]NYI89178.1 IclR family pca regulon transcriptional regulator [Amycolatopsis endophytica]
MTNAAADEGPGHGPHFVQAVGRAFAILGCFGADSPALTASAAAKRTGLDRATARRLLLTLTDLGYVRYDGQAFRLTPRTLDLGYGYLSGLALPEIAHPHLHDLAHRLAETASLTVLDAGDVVHLAVVPGHRHGPPTLTVGTRQPAHPTSGGRVLLAGLPEEDLARWLDSVQDVPGLLIEIEQVRERGWSMAEHDLGGGLRAVAAPVRHRRGRVIAAVNATVHPDRLGHGVVERNYVPELLRAAWSIEADLAKLPE